MKNLINFVLFQAFWFVAVLTAAEGHMWIGPAAVLGFLVVHLSMVEGREERRRELAYVLGVGLVGTFADSLLGAFDVTRYPTSGAWTLAIVPPWITSLWVGFAMLPRFSLGWLRGRTALAAVFGAIGGPLSYLGGARIGAVAVGDSTLLTLGALAVEYAVVTPLLLHFAPGGDRESPRAEPRVAPELECC